MKVSALLNEYFDKPAPRRSRIFEGPSSDLPVSVKKKVWNRDEKGTGRVYEFSQREELKDFTQAVLDFDDESGTGFKIEIDGQRIHVTLAVGEGYRSSDWSMAMLDSIYSEITGR